MEKIREENTDMRVFEIEAIETYAGVLAVRRNNFASDLTRIGRSYKDDRYKFPMSNYIANRVNIRRGIKDDVGPYYDLALSHEECDEFYQQVLAMREDQRSKESSQMTQYERDAGHATTVYDMRHFEGTDRAERYSEQQPVSSQAHASALVGLAYAHILDAGGQFPMRMSVKRALSSVAHHIAEADRLLDLSNRFREPLSFDQLPGIDEWAESLVADGRPHWKSHTYLDYKNVRRSEQTALEEERKGPWFTASLEAARSALADGNVDRYSQRKPKDVTKTTLKKLQGLVDQVTDDSSSIEQCFLEVQKLHDIDSWVCRSLLLGNLVARCEFSPDQPIIDTFEASLGVDLGEVAKREVQNFIGYALFSRGKHQSALRAIREFPQSHATWAIPYMLRAAIDWRTANDLAPLVPLHEKLF